MINRGVPKGDSTKELMTDRTKDEVSYQPVMLWTGIPINRAAINPRHVAICMKLP